MLAIQSVMNKKHSTIHSERNRKFLTICCPIALNLSNTSWASTWWLACGKVCYTFSSATPIT